MIAKIIWIIWFFDDFYNFGLAGTGDFRILNQIQRANERFRFGKNDVDVGSGGSNLDTDTYNLTHYTSSPIEEDTKFIDTIIGVGFLKSDVLSVLDGKRLAAERNGFTGLNPSVGCVVVKNNSVISSGCTSLNGRPHAETNALKFKKNNYKIKHGLCIHRQ